jgi:hypothetical protein
LKRPTQILLFPVLLRSFTFHSTSGLLLIGLGSIGNSARSRSVLLILVGIAVVATFSIVPFFIGFQWEGIDTTKGNDQTALLPAYLGMGFGGLTLLLLFNQLLAILVPKQWIVRYRRFTHCLIPPSVLSEARIKRSAAFKVNRMVQNAYEIHLDVKGSRRDSCEGRALLSFAKNCKQYTSFTFCGAWRAVFSGTLTSQDGIWLSSRLVAGVCSQLCAILFLFVILTRAAVDLVHENNPPPDCVTPGCDSVDEAICLAECKMESENYYTAILCSSTCECVDPCVAAFPPWTIVTSASMALVAGLGTTLAIVFFYIPSYICTTLKFRTGIYATLDDRFFPDYRQGMDAVTSVLGAMFWSVFLAGLGVAVLIGGFTFVVISPVSSWGWS